MVELSKPSAEDLKEFELDSDLQSVHRTRFNRSKHHATPATSSSAKKPKVIASSAAMIHFLNNS